MKTKLQSYLFLALFILSLLGMMTSFFVPSPGIQIQSSTSLMQIVAGLWLVLSIVSFLVLEMKSFNALIAIGATHLFLILLSIAVFALQEIGLDYVYQGIRFPFVDHNLILVSVFTSGFFIIKIKTRVMLNNKFKNYWQSCMYYFWGVLISGLLGAAVLAVEKFKAIDSLDKTAKSRSSILQNLVDNSLNNLLSIERFYAGSEGVTEEEFRTFTKHFIGKDSIMESVTWISSELAFNPGNTTSLQQVITVPAELKLKNTSEVFALVDLLKPTFKRIASGAKPFSYYSVYQEDLISLGNSSNRPSTALILVIVPLYSSEHAASKFNGFLIGQYNFFKMLDGAFAKFSQGSPFIEIYANKKDDKSGPALVSYFSEKREINETENLKIPDAGEGIGSFTFANKTFETRFYATQGFLNNRSTCLSFVIFLLGLLVTVVSASQQRKLTKEKEKSLEREERFSSSFKYASHGMALVSLQGEWLKVNPAVCAIMGYSESELMAKTFQEITHPDDLQSDLEFVNQMLRYERDSYQMEKRYFKKDGSIVWVLLSVSLVSSEDRIPKYFISQIQDVTAKKEAVEKLEEARRSAELAAQAKSNFLSNMSHEIRTPLTAILGFTEQILDPDLSADERFEAKQIILRNSKHLLDVVNDTLDFSKIEAGKLNLNIENCHLFEIVELLESTFKQQALNKNIEFQTSIQYPVPAIIRSDSLRIKQILINLIGNAIKFTKNGKVNFHVVYENVNNSLSFSVRDTGIGMNEEQLSRLFNGYYQGDCDTTKKYGGTGLGLAISKKLSILLNGSLEVESKIGEGSNFVLSLPCSNSDGAYVVNDNPLRVSRVPESSAIKVKYSGKVLVAEDGKDNQLLIKKLLNKLGLEVVLVDNGQQVIERALSDSFDLVFVDMQMPILDGCAAICKLNEADYRVPIVAFTADSTEETSRRMSEVGCVEILNKPFVLSDLKRVLGKYLESSNVDKFIALDPSELAELKMEYAQTIANCVKDLQLAGKDLLFDDMQILAHKLRSSRMFGFKMLGDLAEDLEFSAKERNGEASIGLISRIVSVYEVTFPTH